jgi:1-acyl-sn-glycerol-3-phosphate acyltransferase
MTTVSSAIRLGWAATYTLGMCRKAMWEKAWGAHDERVRELTKAWANGLSARMQIEVRAHGVDTIDWASPCVVMANHQSYLDVLALYRALPRCIGFIAKKPLFFVPLFGGVMRSLGCVPIDRSKRTEALLSVKDAASRVRAGSSIAVFPEGTRSGGDRIAPLKKGPFVLTELAGVPVVPIGIRGTAALMPRQNSGIRPGTIEVHAGAPISLADRGAAARKALMNQVRVELGRLADLPVID